MRNSELFWIVGIVAMVAVAGRMGWKSQEGAPQVAQTAPSPRPSSRVRSMFEVPPRRVATGSPTARAGTTEEHFVTYAERDEFMSDYLLAIEGFKVSPRADGSLTVLVANADSFIHHCGVRKDDIISRVNGKTPQTAWNESLGAQRGDVMISLVRGGRPRELLIHFVERTPAPSGGG